MATNRSARALAPRSDLKPVIKALEGGKQDTATETPDKPQVGRLLPHLGPNPHGPFATKFPPIHEVFIDFRPKEGQGLGDQLLYTPLLLALLDRFPDAHFTILAEKIQLYEGIQAHPAFRERLTFLNGRQQHTKQEFLEKIPGLGKNSLLVNISALDYPLQYKILGTGVHYMFIETKVRKADLGFISRYDSQGKETSEALSNTAVRHAINRHEKIEAILLDLGIDPEKYLKEMANSLLGPDFSSNKEKILGELGVTFHKNQRLLLITPTAGVPSRDLDPGFIISTVLGIAKDGPWNVLIYASTDERAQKLAARLQTSLNGLPEGSDVRFITEAGPLRQYMALVATADLHLTPDTFGSHWSRFAGTPAITVMNDIPASPTVEWMPRGERLYRLNLQELTDPLIAPDLARFLAKFDMARREEHQSELIADNSTASRVLNEISKEIERLVSISSTAEARDVLTSLNAKIGELAQTLTPQPATWLTRTFSALQATLLTYLNSIDEGKVNEPKVLELEEPIHSGIYWDHLRTAWNVSLTAEMIRGYSEIISSQTLHQPEWVSTEIKALQESRFPDQILRSLDRIHRHLRDQPEVTLIGAQLSVLIEKLQSAENNSGIRDNALSIIYLLIGRSYTTGRALHLGRDDLSLLLKVHLALERSRRTGIGVSPEIMAVHDEDSRRITEGIVHVDRQSFRDAVALAVLSDVMPGISRDSKPGWTFLASVFQLLLDTADPLTEQAAEDTILRARSGSAEILAPLFHRLQTAADAETRIALLQTIGVLESIQRTYSLSSEDVAILWKAQSEATDEEDTRLLDGLLLTLYGAQSAPLSEAQFYNVLALYGVAATKERERTQRLYWIVARTLRDQPGLMTTALSAANVPRDDEQQQAMVHAIGSGLDRARTARSSHLNNLLDRLSNPDEEAHRETTGEVLGAMLLADPRDHLSTLFATARATQDTDTRRVLLEKLADVFDSRWGETLGTMDLEDGALEILFEIFDKTQEEASRVAISRSLAVLLPRLGQNYDGERLGKLIEAARTAPTPKLKQAIHWAIRQGLANQRFHIDDLFQRMGDPTNDDERFLLATGVVEYIGSQESLARDYGKDFGFQVKSFSGEQIETLFRLLSSPREYFSTEMQAITTAVRVSPDFEATPSHLEIVLTAEKNRSMKWLEEDAMRLVDLLVERNTALYDVLASELTTAEDPDYLGLVSAFLRSVAANNTSIFNRVLEQALSPTQSVTEERFLFAAKETYKRSRQVLSAGHATQICRIFESATNPQFRRHALDMLHVAYQKPLRYEGSAIPANYFLHRLRQESSPEIAARLMKILTGTLLGERNPTFGGEILDTFLLLAQTNPLLAEPALMAVGILMKHWGDLALTPQQVETLLNLAISGRHELDDILVPSLSAAILADEKLLATLLQPGYADVARPLMGPIVHALGHAIDRHPDFTMPEHQVEVLLKGLASRATRGRPEDTLRVLEYLFFRRPSAFNADTIRALSEITKSLPEAKYLLWYVTMGEPEARESLLLDFPLREPIRAILGSGSKKALVVENIQDGQGDELITIGTFVQALLDFNPELEIDLYTSRPYLYDHPRVHVRHRHAYRAEMDLDNYDLVAERYWGKKGPLLNISKGSAPPLVVDLTRGAGGIPYARRFLIHGKKFKGTTSGNNVYSSTFKILAEMGIPFQWGTHRVRENSLFTSRPHIALDDWWDHNIDTKDRPVVVVNGFGGQSESKGYATNRAKNFATDVADIIRQGFFVVILPNHQAWGSRRQAEIVRSYVPETLQNFLAIGPEPQEDSRLLKYLVERANAVVTVEGGMMHLAYAMGKPFVLLQMPGSGDINWWLARSISYQRTNYMEDWQNVGELVQEAIQRTLQQLPKPQAKPLDPDSTLVETAA